MFIDKLLAHNKDKEIMKKTLRGVKHEVYSTNKDDIALCRHIENVLISEGIKFKNQESRRIPWLVAKDPFEVDKILRKKIEELGQAVFAFLDAVQALYKEEERVREILDIGAPDELRGLDPDRGIVTFRLDVIIEKGNLKIAEIEEVYGGIGKIHALHKAYGIHCNALYEEISKTGIERIMIDDRWSEYAPELQILRRKLKTEFGINPEINYLSQYRENMSGVTLRYAYTRDLRLYDPALRKQIINGNVQFINPLFHGYATKAIFSVLFDESLKYRLKQKIGQKYYDLLINGCPRTKLIDSHSINDVESFMDNRKKSVLKVINASGDTDYHWGSKGVFFGDISKVKWEETIRSVLRGEIPYNPDIRGVRYILSDLVKSDRYDIPFWNHVDHNVSLMKNALIRLEPVFFRLNGRGSRLVGGMATFVNTSRKVHLGKHAVFAPLSFS